MDSVPIVSQLKSLVQFTFSDADGARRTQENFSRQCAVISQLRSLVEYVSGDEKAARETQKEFINVLLSTVDAAPFVGHMKGIVHYATGNEEAGDNCMKLATRTVGSIGGSIIGTAVLGPVGAAIGYASAGYAMDLITTGVHSAIEGELRPSGIVQSLTEAIKDPKDPGKWFDAVVPFAMDAASVASACKAQARWKIDQKLGKKAGRMMVNAADDMRELYEGGQVKDGHVTSVAYEDETGKYATGHNQTARNNCGISVKEVVKIDHARKSCSEYHARQEACVKGIKPDSIVTVHKVPGGIEPMLSCPTCSDHTTAGFNVPTNTIERCNQSHYRVPSRFDTNVGKVFSRTILGVKDAAIAVAQKGVCDEDDNSDESNDEDEDDANVDEPDEEEQVEFWDLSTM